MDDAKMILTQQKLYLRFWIWALSQDNKIRSMVLDPDTRQKQEAIVPIGSILLKIITNARPYRELPSYGAQQLGAVNAFSA